VITILKWDVHSAYLSVMFMQQVELGIQMEWLMAIRHCLVRDVAVRMREQLLHIAATALHCCVVDVSWLIALCAALMGTVFAQLMMPCALR